jgi:DNA-binding transcriptional LysR family regulator
MDTLTGMRAFVAVVEAGGFTAAEQKSTFSKALLSKYVSQLEERLQTRLLTRTTRSVSLTEDGQTYYQGCIDLLERADDLEGRLRDNKGDPQGLLRIAAPQTFGEMFISDAVADFCTLHDKINVDISYSDRFVNIVEEGFDLALRIRKPEDSSLIAKKLGTTSLLLCASPEYLENAPEISHPEDLPDHICIADSNFQGGGNWRFYREEEEFSIKIQPRFRINSARAARDLAILGKGITLVPGFAAVEEIRNGRLVQLLDEYSVQQSTIYAVYPHRRLLSRKTRSFIDFLADRFRTKKNLWDL